MFKLFFIVSIFITCIKLSFYHTYVSTDFEVHRNWLAITHRLPIRHWYYDNTSKWTLDYPPFFAWFECALSQLSKKFDENMTVVENINYMSYNTKLFQKISVILFDTIYLIAIFKIIYCKPISKLMHDSLFTILTTLKLLGSFGLLLIDHIHFQYNGMLFGFLFLSIANLMRNRHLWAAFWFAVLLNFKHIYIYYAPAFGVYLFFHFCFVKTVDNEDQINKYHFDFKRFYQLASIVVGIFVVSFGPFIAMNQLGQVMSRLFPFDSRGLTHAYWAPNAWAIYNSLDMALSKFVATFIGDSNLSNDMTKGLVEKYAHLILPSVKPITTLMLTIASIVPALIKCRFSSSITDFLKLLIICGWSAFTFGWHVHEKAILMIILPFMILEILDRKCLGFGFYMTTIGHYSLLPLIATKPEYCLKIGLFLACTCTHYVQVSYMHGGKVLNTISPLLRVHLIMLLPLWVASDFVIPIFMPRLQFLPLMMTSLYCGIGLLIAYVQFYLYYWTGDDKWFNFQAKVKVSNSKKVQ